MSKKKDTIIPRARCQVVDRRIVVPCTHLEECVAPPKHKGIVPILIGLDERQGFAIRSGEHASRGLIMKFCPFCGVFVGEPVYIEYAGLMGIGRKGEGG